MALRECQIVGSLQLLGLNKSWPNQDILILPFWELMLNILLCALMLENLILHCPFQNCFVSHSMIHFDTSIDNVKCYKSAFSIITVLLLLCTKTRKVADPMNWTMHGWKVNAAAVAIYVCMIILQMSAARLPCRKIWFSASQTSNGIGSHSGRLVFFLEEANVQTWAKESGGRKSSLKYNGKSM